MRTAYTGGMANRTFGVEIELVGLTTYRAAEVLRAAGLDAHAEGYNHSTRPFWKVVTDASISGSGCEVVSPVLRGEEGLAALRVALNALVAAGARVNRSCGLHVHVGARDLDLRGFRNAVKMFLRHERGLDALIAPSRRGSNSFCKSNLRHFNYSYYPTAATPEAEVETVAAAFNAIDRARSIDAIISAVNGGDRYFKMNLTSYYRHGTIEIRSHNGSVNASKVCAWVELVVSLVSGATFRAAVLAPRKLNNLDAHRRMKWLLDDAVAVGNPVRAQLARRASALRRRSEQRQEAMAA